MQLARARDNLEAGGGDAFWGMLEPMWRIVVTAGIALCLCPFAAKANEPAQAFLEGLRERKFFDTALEYLESAAANPAIAGAFKETIPYEKGVTLVQGARSQADLALRESQLDEAQKALQTFLSNQSTSIYTVSARSELGKVMVERAMARIERSKKAAQAEKQKLLKEARGLYTEATKVFTGLADELQDRLKSYPAALDPKTDARRIAERDRYRQDLLQSRLLAAATREETADAITAGTKEWTETLTAAAAAYQKVYEDYRTRLAGLYAQMYQGRCLQKLGKHKEATAFFKLLLENPDTDAFRVLKLKALALAVDSWNLLELYPEVLGRAVPVIDSARSSDAQSDELLALRLAVARASQAYAAQLKSQNPRDPQIRKLLTDGRNQATFVSRIPSDYQEAGRKLAAELSAAGDNAPAVRAEPRTFADGKNAAREEIDAMQAAQLLMRTLPGKISAARPPEKETLQKQLAAAQSEAAKSQAEALRLCRLALHLVEKDSDLAEVNLVRYLLCYLLYSEGSFYDAAVAGDFLARHYPESQGARQCARIALSSYLRLYNENLAEDKEFESEQIVSIASHIVKNWADQPEGAEAFNTLIPFMIRAKKLDQAQEYLAQIPADSPQRGMAELKTGQALWASYLENSKQVHDWETGAAPKPDDVDLEAREKELRAVQAKAKQILVAGVERMRATGEVSVILVTASLSLAQVYVDTNEAAKAVALIEDPKIGALTLVKSDDPATQAEGIPAEIYKTALRSYISSLAGGKNAEALIEKARGVMESLKTHMGQTPQGKQNLVAIYVSLARDLQRQMELAEPAVKKPLGVGFENFLSQVAAEATELDVLNWVAETYRGMGASYGTSLESLTPEAKSYFEKAAATLQKILDRGKAEPGFLSPGMQTQVRMQLAQAKKGMGDYIAARDIYVAILKAQPMLLPVQMEAARLYQDWGSAAKNQHENYHRAIVGSQPDPAKNNKNTIWGWGEIARLAAGDAKYREQFHESRYNLALSRYHYAMAKDDPAQKKEQLVRAKSDISLTAGLYPDMGGESWKAQYDNLLKNVQKELGERPIGLAAFQTSPTTPTTTPLTTTTASPAAP